MQIHQPYTRPSQRCYTSPTHYPGGVVLLCCSVCLTLHIGCMFVCELHSYVHESIVRLHIFWSHPLNWCDFIDVTHILVGVHSMVYDALGSFESLNVSSVSCLIYLVFSVVGLGAFFIVWLPSVSRLGDHVGGHFQLLYQHVWRGGCCIIDPVMEVHPPCGVAFCLVPALPSLFVYPVHVVRRPCIQCV